MAAQGKPIGSFVVNVALKDLGLNKDLTGLNRLMRTTQTAQKATEAGFNAMGDRAGKARASIDGLTKQMQIQENIVKKYKTKLDELSNAKVKNQKRIDETSQKLNRQIATYSNMENKLRIAKADLQKFSQEQSKVVTSSEKMATGVTRAMDRIRKSPNGISANFSKMTDQISKSVTSGIITPFTQATNMVKGYAGALGLLSGGALAGTGMARLSAIENAQVSLEVMMGSAEKASGFLDEVLDFAKTTPFAFPDLAESARNLTAFGMGQEKIIPTMQAIGDAAAASGKGSEGFRQIASAMGALQVSGTASLGEINRLMDAGIPAIKILANETGKSVEQIKKDISSGSYDSVEVIDMLVKGMQEGTKGVAGETAAMAGLMERQKDTWVGSVDSMKSSISSTMAKLLDPVKPHIQDFMGFFADNFSKIPDIVFGLADKVKPFIDKFRTNFDSIKETFTNVSNSGVGFKDVFVTVAGFIKDNIGNIKNAFTDFKNLAIPIMDNAKSIFQSLQPVFQTTGRIIKEAITVIAPLIADAGKAILKFVGEISGKWKTFWAENGTVISNAMDNIWKVIQFVMPAVLAIIKSVWGNIKGVIQGAINIIQGVIKTFSGLFTGDWSKMWEGIKQVLSGAVQFLWNAVQLYFVGRIIGVVRGFATSLRSMFVNLWNNVKNLFTQSIGNIVRNAITAFRNFGTSVSNRFNAIKDGIARVWSLVYNGTKNAIQRVIDFGRNGFTRLKDNAVNAFTTLKDRTMSIINGLKDLIKGKFDDFVAMAKDLPKKIGDGIGSMASKISEGVTKLTNKLAETLGKGVNGVISGINWVLEKVGVSTEIAPWAVPQYAKGTKGHPGGLAVLGDGGKQELFKTPDGQVGMSPNTDTLMNLPKGTQVLSGEQTDKVLSSGIPFYKGGVGGWFKELYEKGKNVVLDIADYVKSPSKLLNKILEKLGVQKPDMAGNFGKIAGGGFDYVKTKAVDYIKEKLKGFEGFFNGKSGGSATVKGWIAKAIGISGVPTSWASALETIAMKESGGNPRAINLWDINAKRGIPSKGLMQTIDPTFNAYKRKGHNDIYNPVDNVLAAINYIKSRYGNVFNVPGIRNLNNGGRYVGYDRGGIINRDQFAQVHKGELILPTRDFRKNRGMELLGNLNKSFGLKTESNTSKTNDNDKLLKLLMDSNKKQGMQMEKIIELLIQIVLKPSSFTGQINQDTLIEFVQNGLASEIDILDSMRG